MNGLVAFVLPLVLTLESVRLRNMSYNKVSVFHKRFQAADKDKSAGTHYSRTDSVILSSKFCCMTPEEEEPGIVALYKGEAHRIQSDAKGDGDIELPALSEQQLLLANKVIRKYSISDLPKQDEECVILQQLRYQEYNNTVNALPACLIPYRAILVQFIQAGFTVIVIWSIVMGFIDE